MVFFIFLQNGHFLVGFEDYCDEKKAKTCYFCDLSPKALTFHIHYIIFAISYSRSNNRAMSGTHHMIASSADSENYSNERVRFLYFLSFCYIVFLLITSFDFYFQGEAWNSSKGFERSNSKHKNQNPKH